MLQCAANVCLYNGSVHKKGPRSKNYKTRSRGQGRMHNNSSSSNNTGWDCSDIAGSAQHKRKIEKHSQHTKHFLHTDTNRLCVRECVCGLVYFFVYIFDCFARAFAISFAATLASAAALWVSVVQLLQAIPRSLTARQRRTGQIRGLNVHSHTHTHIHMDKPTDLTRRRTCINLVKLLMLTLRMRTYAYARNWNF